MAISAISHIMKSSGYEHQNHIWHLWPLVARKV